MTLDLDGFRSGNLNDALDAAGPRAAEEHRATEQHRATEETT